MDAEKWLFEPSKLVNSLENICQVLDLDIELVRSFSRSVTRNQVKKMEFLERANGRDQAKALLQVLRGEVDINNENDEDDDGGL